MKKVLPILMLLAIFGLSKSIAQTAYITNNGTNTVSVIDVATNSVITTITVGTHPNAFSVSPDGRKVYVGNQGSGSVSIISTCTNLVIGTFLVGNNPTGVVVSPDSRMIYVAN